MTKTIFISGNFNILHPGHLRLLRFARELGEELIVAVHSDRLGGEAIHVPEDMRLEGLQSNIWVTKAFIIDAPVTETIKQIKPDIVEMGKKHENHQKAELAAIKEYGGKLNNS